MPFEAVCPNGHRLRVTEAHFDHEIKCPTCGAAFVVPDLSKEPAATGLPHADTSATKRRLAMSGGLPDFGLMIQRMGRPMLAVGLVLVLASRGCDSIGNRAAARAQAKKALARAQFNDEWDAVERKLQEKIDDLSEKENTTAADRQRINDLNDRMAETRADRREEKEKLESGDWLELDKAARDAALENQIAGYWREIVFALATVVLAMGLLVTSRIAEGAERWVCLIILAILAFSVFVGGSAWLSSTINSVLPARPTLGPM